MSQEKISLKIRIIANELNRTVAELLKVDGSPFSGKQMHVLNFIYRQEKKQKKTYQKDIEHTFDIRRSTATGVLQTMEKHQLIERKSCKEDHRLKEIHLTEFGYQQVAENIVKLRQFDQALHKGITEEEMASFFSVLDKISENSKQMNQEGRERL